MKSRHMGLLVCFLVIICATATAQAGLKVGTAIAAPGRKAFGAIEVPAGVDAGTTIPVAIIQ